MKRILIRIKYFLNEYKRKLYYGIKREKLKVDLNKENKAYIFLAADYGNLGDIAITYAQREFLKRELKDYDLIEVPMAKTNALLPFLKKIIKENDVITIIGGGNLTNRYDVFEEKRRMIIKTFKNHKIISFPQTIDFTNDIKGQESRRRSIKIYSKNKDLQIFAREEKSYKVMKETFNKNKIYLVPDIVISLKNVIDIKKEKDNKIGICLRNDKEKLVKENLEEKIIQYYKNDKVELLSTCVDDSIVTEENKYTLLKQLLNKFANKDIVVTDRLHGMIFCYITKTPCIAFDNDNHKIKGIYEKWLQSCKYINLLQETDISNIFNVIERLRIQETDDTTKNDNFRELISVLRGEKNE